MKKMFLLLLCCPVVLAAQSGITISDYSVKPGTPATVSFTVSWNKDKIDSAWVVADAAGAFSATVQLVATCRNERPCVPTGACVYAIDYPPRGTAVAYNLLKLSGTPPFYVMYADSTTYVEIDAPTAAGCRKAFADWYACGQLMEANHTTVTDLNCNDCTCRVVRDCWELGCRFTYQNAFTHPSKCTFYPCAEDTNCNGERCWNVQFKYEHTVCE
ncbi:MAG: hypothetical protein LBT49_01375 [Prevotellaceae bacterium]|jgi:hypothetical protein|nr:hypothetical protein [Prevotellaceae bacterium]